MRKMWFIIGGVVCAAVLLYIFKRDFFIDAYYQFLDMIYKVSHPDANF